jgi:tetratricopeptide (TPR) repeat protein
MTPSLAIAMIVRDEERVLARCLASVTGLYDELVIVDTGSCDATIAIAERHGARVHRYSGANGSDGRILDFSDARNVALGHVLGEWVLQIDADEVLQAGHEVIQTVIRNQTTDAVSIRLRSEGSEWHSVRLFRRHAARRYVGRIHEYLEYEGTTLGEEGILIDNLPDKNGKETAYARNVRIALAEISVGNGSSRVWHNLGSEHYRAGDFTQAAHCYGVSLDLGGYPIGRFHGYFYTASCHLLLGEIDTAIARARQAIAVAPDYAEAHCLLGDALFLQDRFAQAAESYRAALVCKGRRPSSPFPTQPWMEEEHPARQLALLAPLL